MLEESWRDAVKEIHAGQVEGEVGSFGLELIWERENKSNNEAWEMKITYWQFHPKQDPPVLHALIQAIEFPQ